MTRRHRAGRTILAAATVLGAASAMATAGETRTWDDSRYTAKGYAKGSITIDFLTKRAFDVKGYVQDVCPRDGFGAYMDVSYVEITRTGYSYRKAWTTFSDTNGCGKRTVPFDPGPVVAPKGSKIASVRAELYYRDADGDGSGAVVVDARIPQTFENWRLR